MEPVLLLSGLLVAAIGTWRGYANARLLVIQNAGHLAHWLAERRVEAHA